jgi:hypothetical protein
MKTSRKLFTLILSVILLSTLYSCRDKVIEVRKFIANKPVYMSYEDMRNGIKSLPGDTLEQTGKIYFYQNYVFVNEFMEGIHVIDNTDPSNPQNIKFIEIPGNVDMVIKDNHMYVDSYVDLVVLNIADINNIVEVFRIKDVFPYTVPEYDYNYPLAQVDDELGVVVGYTIEEVEESYDVSGQQGWGIYRYDYLAETNGGAPTFNDGQGTGIAGSMARFSIYNNNLYLLNNSILLVYDITSVRQPVYVTELNTNTVAETLFRLDDQLFMGTQTGMKVYSLSNPAAPEFISEFSHIQSCDPVVVADGYAYVTLRSGNGCGSVTNQLDVVDIRVITSPQLVKTYPMTNPYGVGIQEDKSLFICDGEDGLKVYDATDPLRIDEHLLYHYPYINAFDVIPLGNLIIMIGADGLYQYSYEDGIMSQLSFVPIGD